MQNLITIKFYTKPYSIFLHRNSTYFLNKPRNCTLNLWQPAQKNNLTNLWCLVIIMTLVRMKPVCSLLQAEAQSLLKMVPSGTGTDITQIYREYFFIAGPDTGVQVASSVVMQQWCHSLYDTQWSNKKCILYRQWIPPQRTWRSARIPAPPLTLSSPIPNLWSFYDICHWCVYSEKFLMMDRGTVRNMWSFIPKINLRNQCISLVLL